MKSVAVVAQKKKRKIKGLGSFGVESWDVNAKTQSVLFLKQ